MKQLHRSVIASDCSWRGCVLAALLCGGLCGGLVGLGGCAGGSGLRSQRAAQGMLQEATDLMSGAFASTQQSQRDPEFFDIRLHMQPIWLERALSAPNERWLYVEQAMSKQLDKPYRQRVYRVRAGEVPGTIVSEVFELPGGREGAAKFVGAWASPKVFSALAPEQLEKREGCEVVLRRVSPGVFEGGTVGTMCLSSLRGATYATSKVTMTSEGLVTWDQGFDANGAQVWGAVKGGYEFRRQP